MSYKYSFSKQLTPLDFLPSYRWWVDRCYRLWVSFVFLYKALTAILNLIVICSGPPSSQNFKTLEILLCNDSFCIHTHQCLNNIPYYQEILRTKNLDSPTLHLSSLTAHRSPNKTKIFGYKSDILIKYKRIKWTPSHKALHLLPGG